MRGKFASVIPINQRAKAKNWRATVGDVLAEKNVRGVVVTVFYRDGDYLTSWSGARQSDLALAAARLIRLATDELA